MVFSVIDESAQACSDDSGARTSSESREMQGGSGEPESRFNQQNWVVFSAKILVYLRSKIF